MTSGEFLDKGGMAGCSGPGNCGCGGAAAPAARPEVKAVNGHPGGEFPRGTSATPELDTVHRTPAGPETKVPAPTAGYDGLG